MFSTTSREPKRVRSARRRAAYHAERARRASTPEERYRVAEYALTSAVQHSRHPARTAARVVDDIAEHARRAMSEAGLGGARAALYEQQLATHGSHTARLARALMCLRGAIAHLPDTERDRLFEHYARELTEEAGRIASEGGDR